MRIRGGGAIGDSRCADDPRHFPEAGKQPGNIEGSRKQPDGLQWRLDRRQQLPHRSQCERRPDVGKQTLQWRYLGRFDRDPLGSRAGCAACTGSHAGFGTPCAGRLGRRRLAASARARAGGPVRLTDHTTCRRQIPRAWSAGRPMRRSPHGSGRTRRRRRRRRRLGGGGRGSRWWCNRHLRWSWRWLDRNLRCRWQRWQTVGHIAHRFLQRAGGGGGDAQGHRDGGAREQDPAARETRCCDLRPVDPISRVDASSFGQGTPKLDQYAINRLIFSLTWARWGGLMGGTTAIPLVIRRVPLGPTYPGSVSVRPPLLARIDLSALGGTAGAASLRTAPRRPSSSPGGSRSSARGRAGCRTSGPRGSRSRRRG
jgi:hypothetical protein